MEGGGSGEDPGDVEDIGSKDGKDEAGAVVIYGIVCTDERPNVEGEGEGHSVSDERVR
jgi:hypothetical protein